MKKLILLLMLIPFLGIANDTTSQKEIDQNSIVNISETQTERIVDKYGGKIVEGFNSLIKSATPIAIEGFELVVKLQLAKGIAMILPIIFFIILTIISYKMWGTEHINNDEVSLPGVIVIILLIINFSIALFSTYTGIVHLVAPEWFAIKEILGLIK